MLTVLRLEPAYLLDPQPPYLCVIDFITPDPKLDHWHTLVGIAVAC